VRAAQDLQGADEARLVEDLTGHSAGGIAFPVPRCPCYHLLPAQAVAFQRCFEVTEADPDLNSCRRVFAAVLAAASFGTCAM
jgi:hypothetical protein